MSSNNLEMIKIKERMYQGYAICRDNEGLYTHYYTVDDHAAYQRAHEIPCREAIGIVHNQWLDSPVTESELENLADQMKRELDDY